MSMAVTTAPWSTSHAVSGPVASQECWWDAMLAMLGDFSSVHLGANGNIDDRQLVNWTVNWSGRWKLAFAKPSVEDQWE